jgi:hypothetical protein
LVFVEPKFDKNFWFMLIILIRLNITNIHTGLLLDTSQEAGLVTVHFSSYEFRTKLYYSPTRGKNYLAHFWDLQGRILDYHQQRSVMTNSVRNNEVLPNKRKQTIRSKSREKLSKLMCCGVTTVHTVEAL